MLRSIARRFDAGRRLLALRAVGPAQARETAELLRADAAEIWRFCAEAKAVAPVLSAVYANAGLGEVLRLRSEIPKASKDLVKESQDVLRPWFNAGLLQLHRVELGDPLLPFLARTDAVLPRYDRADDPDFLVRFGPARRCFALRHPSLDLPVCYVYTALVTDVPAAYSDIPALESPEGRVLVFYAITNPLQGLGGLDLGNVLIKKAAGRMLEGCPDLRLVTLSPMPLFRRWLGGDEPSVQRALSYVSTRACPVANFHLRNGAIVHRVNTRADPSETGMKRSHGYMVNYLYVPEDIEANHCRYVDAGHAGLGPELREAHPQFA